MCRRCHFDCPSMARSIYCTRRCPLSFTSTRITYTFERKTRRTSSLVSPSLLHASSSGRRYCRQTKSDIVRTQTNTILYYARVSGGYFFFIIRTENVNISTWFSNGPLIRRRGQTRAPDRENIVRKRLPRNAKTFCDVVREEKYPVAETCWTRAGVLCVFVLRTRNTVKVRS